MRARDLDLRAVATGAALTLAVAVPPVLLVRIVKGDDLRGTESNLWLVSAIAIISGFFAGGFLAGRRRPALPLAHGSAAGALAYALFFLETILRHVVTGEDVGVTFAKLVLLGMLVIPLALLGGWTAMWVEARQARARSTTEADA